MGQLGVLNCTLHDFGWVIRYSVDFAESMRPFEKPVGRSWRCDETYVLVGGGWMYLYRGSVMPGAWSDLDGKKFAVGRS